MSAHYVSTSSLLLPRKDQCPKNAMMSHFIMLDIINFDLAENLLVKIYASLHQYIVIWVSICCIDPNLEKGTTKVK